MKTGHKHGRLSAPRHRWREKWLPHRLNERWPTVQVFHVKPDYDRLPIVEVRYTRTRLEMYAAIWRDGRTTLATRWTDAICRSWRPEIEWKHSREVPRRQRLNWRHAIARIYFNKQDLGIHPANTIAHECGHAAMTWARYRGADFSLIDGEETMAYALGALMQQVNRSLQARGAYRL